MHKWDPRDACTYRKELVSTQQEDIIYKPRVEVSDPTNTVNILILDFQPLALWEDNFVV